MSEQTKKTPEGHDEVIEWLGSLKEPEFRDRILLAVFKQMKTKGLIKNYRNIHGRNDKGVDYIVTEKSALNERIVGIQVKSCRITRASGANGAVAVKAECESALGHEFSVDSRKLRLDSIEVWNSGHTTPDAIDEFSTTGKPYRIPLKLAADIAHIIEEHAPQYLKKIPGYSIKNYLKKELLSEAGNFAIFGCQLNPGKHFLEPNFVSEGNSDLGKLEVKDKKLKPVRGINLATILETEGHIAILGSQVSGKTYTLKHILARLAEKNPKCVPVFFRDIDTLEITKSNIDELIGKTVCGFKKAQIQALSSSYQFVLLIDRIDQLEQGVVEHLLSLNPDKYRIIGTAEKIADKGERLNKFKIDGVRIGSLTKFLRQLDSSLGSARSMTDQAMNYISRVTGRSGLPPTPFVIATCLKECGDNPDSLSTPTFGHLIERFIQGQTGETGVKQLVDYETKRDFLTLLADSRNSVLPIEEYDKKLDTFLVSSGSPHNRKSFKLDYEKAGILNFSRDGKLVSWEGSAYLGYYWLRNRMDAQALHEVEELLRSERNYPLAALYGSLIGNCQNMVSELLALFTSLEAPTSLESLNSNSLDGFLPNDEEEYDGFLSAIETASAESENALSKESNQPEDLDPDVDLEISSERQHKLSEAANLLSEELKEQNFPFIMNLAALLLNGRRTDVELKVQSCKEIILGVVRFGRILAKLLSKEFPEISKSSSAWLILFIELQLADRLIGDAYLKDPYAKYDLENSSIDEKVILLDLKLSHGVLTDEEFIEGVKEINKKQATVALHMRLSMLYYFRHQNPDEKKRLREIIKQIGKASRGLSLPSVEKGKP